MASKATWIATGVLIVGAAIALSVGRDGESRDARLGQPLLAGAAVPEVETIKIKRGEGEPLLLVKDAANVWHLGDQAGFPVDAAKVVRFLDELSGNTYRDLAPSGAPGEFGLDGAIVVTLGSKNGGDVLTLALGNDRPGGGQYVAPGGETKVYLINQTIPSGRSIADADHWEMKTLLSVPKEEVKAVAFQPAAGSGRKPVTLARAAATDPLKIEGGERAKNGGEAGKSSAAVASADTLFTNLAFSKRHDPSNAAYQAALDKSGHVTLTLFDGRRYDLVFGTVGKETKQSFLKIAATAPEGASEEVRKSVEALNQLMAAHAFEVSQSVLARLDKGAADFAEVGTKG